MDHKARSKTLSRRSVRWRLKSVGTPKTAQTPKTPNTEDRQKPKTVQTPKSVLRPSELKQNDRTEALRNHEWWKGVKSAVRKGNFFFGNWGSLRD